MTNSATNSPTTAATLHAYFSYRDAPAALSWLNLVLDFETTMQAPDGKGGIAHAELRRGDAVFVVFSDDEGYDRPQRKGETVGHGAYIHVAGEAEVQRRARVGQTADRHEVHTGAGVGGGGVEGQPAGGLEPCRR